MAQKKIWIFLVALFLTGCGTIISFQVPEGQAVPSAGIYSGVRIDGLYMLTYAFPLGIIDFPFSFVADTVVLPYTIYLATQSKESDPQEVPKSEKQTQQEAPKSEKQTDPSEQSPLSK